QQLTEDNIFNYVIIINLCGYNIGQKRWTKAVKDIILSSRIETTNKLIRLISKKNIWLINDSAIVYNNFYNLDQDKDN
ncbi:epimerase, partial [Francisella tularensis subsp. holarctica]|nr:epimerase [Francisella tularensis subsp. holarctica]